MIFAPMISLFVTAVKLYLANLCKLTNFCKFFESERIFIHIQFCHTLFYRRIEPQTSAGYRSARGHWPATIARIAIDIYILFTE